jgi:hypothetical protein
MKIGANCHAFFYDTDQISQMTHFSEAKAAVDPVMGLVNPVHM